MLTSARLRPLVELLPPRQLAVQVADRVVDGVTQQRVDNRRRQAAVLDVPADADGQFARGAAVQLLTPPFIALQLGCHGGPVYGICHAKSSLLKLNRSMTVRSSTSCQSGATYPWSPGRSVLS